MTPVHWTYLTYALTAIGAIGLYLAMPRIGASRRAPAILLGAISIGGLLALLRFGFGERASTNIYFYILAFLTIAGAVRVVTHPRPVYAALFFVMVVLASAGLAFMAGAEFLGAALVIVYAGAILVTYVFVIMLAQQSSEDDINAPIHYDAESREPATAVMAGFVLVATLAGLIVGRNWPAAANPGAAEASNTIAIGRELMTRYAVSVEVAGVLLMVAMIGALAIARKHVPADEFAPRSDLPPPGEIGRRVKPF